MLGASSPNNPLEKHLRDCCAELERRLAVGETCCAEQFLALFPEFGSDEELALDLIYTEYRIRLERKPRLLAEEFYQRFPRLHEALRRQFELHEWIDHEQTAVGDSGSALEPTCFLPGQASAGGEPGEEGDFAGRYELLDVIARGGMGTIYRAWQPTLKRIVAIKMIPNGEERRGLFRAEAEAVARLQHPHIVQAHEAGEWKGILYLVFEYLAGGNLAQALAGVRLPATKAARLTEKLARAVHYTHEKGVIHRDLKPANILLAEDGTPKVSDFGLAKLLVGGEGTETGVRVLGTPTYMAPEQAAGREVGRYTDVYGLGGLLYEALTGQPPFQATALPDAAPAERRVAVPPSCRRPGLPRDLEAICLKCLEADPQERYPSALELADDLRRFRLGKPPRARPWGPRRKVV